MSHVAVLKPEYIQRVLDGRKTIESRLSRVRVAPFARVATGDLIYLKSSGGPIRARAAAGRVWHFDNLCPRRIDLLERRFARRVQAPPEYWRSQRHAKYACFIELLDVTPLHDAPSVPRLFGAGWIILPDETPATRRSA